MLAACTYEGIKVNHKLLPKRIHIVFSLFVFRYFLAFRASILTSNGGEESKWSFECHDVSVVLTMLIRLFIRSFTYLHWFVEKQRYHVKNNIFHWKWQGKGYQVEEQRRGQEKKDEKSASQLQ